MAERSIAIDAGQLRHRIQIQAQASASDGFGQPSQSWTTIRTTNADIRTGITAREAYQQGQLTSQLTHAITVRWTKTTITAGMQVVFGSRKFKIQNVVNADERNALVKLLCLELGPTS